MEKHELGRRQQRSAKDSVLRTEGRGPQTAPSPERDWFAHQRKEGLCWKMAVVRGRRSHLRTRRAALRHLRGATARTPRAILQHCSAICGAPLVTRELTCELDVTSQLALPCRSKVTGEVTSCSVPTPWLPRCGAVR